VSYPDSFPETVLWLLVSLAAARVTWVLADQLWLAVTDTGTKSLSHDEMVRVLQEVYDTSPRARATVLDSLAGIDPVQAVPPLTPFQWILVTLWFFFIAWVAWHLSEYFVY
jgi:hypothetical protein